MITTVDLGPPRPKVRPKIAPLYSRRKVRILAALWLPSTQEHPLPNRTLRVAFLRQKLTAKRRSLKGYKYSHVLPKGKAKYDLRHFN